MGAFSVWHWLIILVVVGLPLWFTSRVLSKAGYSGWWALIGLVPLVNIAMLWVFAYAKWPSQSQSPYIRSTIRMNPFPEPIADRISHVGGIESLVLDGQTYFFGFDYSSDLVISPLINSIDVMAQFASRYMEQRDGAHDVDYWRGLAEMSTNNSELCADLESRTFSSAQLANTVTAIAQAAQKGSTANGLSIKYHLLYLLGAAGDWSGPGLDEIEELIAQLSGQETQNEQTMRAAAGALQDALNKLVSAAPGNWAVLFASLQST